LERNFSPDGDFLKNFLDWYLSTTQIADGYLCGWPLARSADDVLRVLDAGGEECSGDR
jgi:hypothetical protein